MAKNDGEVLVHHRDDVSQHIMSFWIIIDHCLRLLLATSLLRYCFIRSLVAPLPLLISRPLWNVGARRLRNHEQQPRWTFDGGSQQRRRWWPDTSDRPIGNMEILLLLPRGLGVDFLFNHPCLCFYCRVHRPGSKTKTHSLPTTWIYWWLYFEPSLQWIIWRWNYLAYVLSLTEGDWYNTRTGIAKTKINLILLFRSRRALFVWCHISLCTADVSRSFGWYIYQSLEMRADL